MALTDRQLEIISDALVPLFQYLENEVIVEVARRIAATLSYTTTAENMAREMAALGYSPAKIRAAAMKLLRSNPQFRKEVAKNTLQFKKQIKKILRQIQREAIKEGDALAMDVGNLAQYDDLRIWKQAGKEITDQSFLPQLVEGMKRQTAEQLTNLTGTTGFKLMSGFESMETLYRQELDKAMIKVCSGTFSQERVVYDVVHDLASSGLRTIDFSSGRSMQLDTAVKLAIRTGANQLSGQITSANIMSTDTNLVYVSRHIGARNNGTGHANHEQWQGKVYFIRDGVDYSEEAKRIGQDRITSLWYATGYSMDGSRPNDPQGLYGYNCRHRAYAWFEGVFELPPKEEEPAVIKIGDKEYDYYARTQKQRAMERNIRNLKREREALAKLNMDTGDISRKIKQKIGEYEQWCDRYGMPEDMNRLRYECDTSDLTKTRAWKKYKDIADAEKDGIIESQDFIIHQGVGAKALNYDVLLPGGQIVNFTEGSRISNIKTIAGHGRDRQIDEVDILVEQFGGDSELWEKKKGLGYVDYEGESYKTEVHWYEEPTVGKVKFKVKSYNGEWIIDE